MIIDTLWRQDAYVKEWRVMHIQDGKAFMLREASPMQVIAKKDDQQGEDDFARIKRMCSEVVEFAARYGRLPPQGVMEIPEGFTVEKAGSGAFALKPARMTK